MPWRKIKVVQPPYSPLLLSKIKPDRYMLSGTVRNFPFLGKQKQFETEQEISRLITSSIQKSKQKFRNYSDCLKILLLEIYGDELLIFQLDIYILIHQLNVEPDIDQIWLTELEYITDCNYGLVYRQVFKPIKD